jgi:hypothetical protein
MTYQELIRQLRPGDVLVYNTRSFFGWLISFKTWHSITHVEVYAGDELAIAARTAGVNVYKIETQNLVGVYRPNQPFNFEAGMEWFNKEARYQKYDWKGILGFIRVVPGGDRTKQFCSELMTRFCRKEGLDPFPREDADKIAPFQITISPYFDKVLDFTKKT